MNERIKNMTSGRPVGLLLRFALPLMVGNVFQQLYTVVDTAVVGKALGVNALAALGASDWLNWMVLGIAQGLTQGFGIQMAQSFGAKQLDELRRTVANSMTLSAIGAVVLVIFSQLLVNPILLLLQTPAEIIPDSLLYLRIMFMGIPVVMAYNLLAVILRSLGDSSTPLYAMIVAALTNIVLDLLFVLGFHWGIAGAAAATLIAQGVSSVFCYVRLCRISFLRMEYSDWCLTPAMSGRLLMLGFPTAFQNAIIAIGGMIVQLVVNGFGVIFIAGFTATNKLYGLLEIAAVSYGYAMVTYVGQNLGAGQIGRIKSGVRAGNGVGLATSGVIAAAMLLFGRPILSLFLSGDADTVAQAMEIAYCYLAVMSIGLPILYYLHVIRSSLQGLGNTVLPMASGVVEFIMRTASAALLPALLGNMGIFLAEPLAWLGADVVLGISYVLTMRKLSKTQ